MIGKLKGTLDSYGEDFVILDVHGVGYLVHCSARTLQALPAVGEAVELAIETHVREDQIRLFGFGSATEREWFRLLQTVQGVGTKVALAVLSVNRQLIGTPYRHPKGTPLRDESGRQRSRRRSWSGLRRRRERGLFDDHRRGS